MKKLLLLCLLILSLTTIAAAQSKDEQEILKIHHGLDEAFLKRDIAYFERVLADDYVYSEFGIRRNRDENLEKLLEEWTDRSYQSLASTSDNVKVKISGNMALITGNWAFTAVSTIAANAEPIKVTGRYTGVYEKRDGNWLLIAEHFSEATLDRKWMQQQVLKMSQEYTRMIKNQDVESIRRVLADDYLFTNERGKVQNRAENLENYKTNPVKIEILEVSDQKARAVGNYAVVETGSIRYKGTDKNGKPFVGSERYTTTWVWRNFRWQIVGDHSSDIKD